MLKTKIPQSVRQRHAFAFLLQKKIRTEVPSFRERKKFLLLIVKNGVTCLYRLSFTCIIFKNLNFNLKTCINVAVYETTTTCINHDRIQFYDTYVESEFILFPLIWCDLLHIFFILNYTFLTIYCNNQATSPESLQTACLKQCAYVLCQAVYCCRIKGCVCVPHCFKNPIGIAIPSIFSIFFYSSTYKILPVHYD